MPNQEFDTLLSKSKTAKRVGTCTRTVDRWTCLPELGFPKPCIINKRRYFSAWQIEDWLESCKPGGPPMPADTAPPEAGLIPPQPMSMARAARLQERREAKQARADRRNASEVEVVDG
jgi:hypothetical protein